MADYYQENWRFYQNDAPEPTLPLATENTKPTLINFDPIRLRTTIKNLVGGSGTYETSLQWSTNPAGPWSDMAQIDPAALWDYAEGLASGGDPIVGFLTSDGNNKGTYHEVYSYPQDEVYPVVESYTEMDFTINSVAASYDATYYFRCIVNSVGVGIDGGKTYPQVTMPALTTFVDEGPLGTANDDVLDFTSILSVVHSVAKKTEWGWGWRFDDPVWTQLAITAKKGVRCIEFGDEFYVGTSGTTSGSARIYRWNIGDTWTQMGGNLPGANCKEVRCMVEFGGTIYVGTWSPGIVYYWDGAAWQSAGQLGAETNVSDLAVIGTTLYGCATNGTVYEYSAGVWSAISGSFTGSRLAVLSGELYGVYGSLGVLTTVSKYGTPFSWSIVGTTMDAPSNSVPLIANFEDKLYVITAPSDYSSKVYRYDADWVFIEAFNRADSAFKTVEGRLWVGVEDGGVWSMGVAGATIALSVASLSPSCFVEENATSQTFDVSNSGGGTLTYTISDNVTWLACVPNSGTSTGELDTITVNYTTSGLSVGVHSATITIEAIGATNTPQTISVSLDVTSPTNEMTMRHLKWFYKRPKNCYLGWR